jgi:hypothetical protein
MHAKAFDSFATGLANASSRRALVARVAKTTVGAGLVVALGRGTAASAGHCHHGPGTCVNGFVWREAFLNDHVCVTPDVRTRARLDNMELSGSRYVGGGGPGWEQPCVSGYVWRKASPSDFVCVEPWVREQVAYDNSQAASRVAPGCAY